MQESDGKLHRFGNEKELKKAQKKLNDLIPLTEVKYDELNKLPKEQRTSQFHFDKWIETYHPDVDGELKSKLRHAYKLGFVEAERIYKK